MSEPAVPVSPESAAPLVYRAGPRRGVSTTALVGLAVGVISAVVPAYMTAQILTGQRRRFAVFKSYLRESVTVAGHPVSVYANWPWYALDAVAMLLGLIGLYRGGRVGWAALAVGTVSMAAKLTIVLGSPW